MRACESIFGMIISSIAIVSLVAIIGIILCVFIMELIVEPREKRKEERKQNAK